MNKNLSPSTLIVQGLLEQGEDILGSVNESVSFIKEEDRKYRLEHYTRLNKLYKCLRKKLFLIIRRERGVYSCI